MMTFIRGYDGIGRHARFRFSCLWRAGSTPVTRTTEKSVLNSFEVKSALFCYAGIFTLGYHTVQIYGVF